MLNGEQALATLIALSPVAVITAWGRFRAFVEPQAERKGSERVDEEAILDGTEWVLSSLEGNGLLERSISP